MAVERGGGQCQICGYSRCKQALEFHHLKPDEKLFCIGTTGRSWEQVATEVDKCILLCSNCHREVEYGLVNLLDYLNGRGTV